MLLKSKSNMGSYSSTDFLAPLAMSLLALRELQKEVILIMQNKCVRVKEKVGKQRKEAEFYFLVCFGHQAQWMLKCVIRPKRGA